MKIVPVDFPEPLLNALRDKRLVVFAGAGVSMGAPACLPSFQELASQIAEGTGLTINEQESESEDQFLERVESHSPGVKERAAQLLQKNNPEPTQLHCNLLRLSPESDDVHIVTTNFDLLFEKAANSLFCPTPKMYEAPALPLGQRFRGIVHIHGSVANPKEMVLTSRDFGRAYLTEADGWARRFLADLFNHFTVLFIGYSHNDPIITYLTPSLPRYDTDQRYALVGDQSETHDRWRNLGIRPVVFPQADKNDYVEQDRAVKRLAYHIRRGVLDWQREITDIAKVSPTSIDEETAGTIQYALSDLVLTRFFTKAAEDPAWIPWLDRHRHLDSLFADDNLTEPENRLAHWLAENFVVNHSEELFEAIKRHNTKVLNPMFWRFLCWKIHNSSQEQHDTEKTRNLTQWVFFLVSAIPKDANGYDLLNIAKVCANTGVLHGLLRAYETMGTCLNPFLSRNLGLADAITKTWTQCLEPHLPQIAESLLEITTRILEERHAIRRSWQQANDNWDPDSYGRSAIEPHEQDTFADETHAFIDIARGCLEWLATNQADSARLWTERLVLAQAPLSRRLAIHTVTKQTNLSADDKISWLLAKIDIHNTSIHHEVFTLVRASYPQASQEIRTNLIDAIRSFHESREDTPDKERYEDYRCYRWFYWLHKADPKCKSAKTVWDNMQVCHPDFKPPEHPDLTHWTNSGWATSSSPRTKEELLTHPPAEMLPVLLEYQPTVDEQFNGYDRSGLLDTVEKAAQADPAWSLELADAITEQGKADSDLWPSLIRAWTATDLDPEHQRRVLRYLATSVLHEHHVSEIAAALYDWAIKAEGPEYESFLPAAKAIATKLHDHAVNTKLLNDAISTDGTDWLPQTINHPSRKLALFWLQSISWWRRQQAITPASLNDEYRNTLNVMIQDRGITGKLACSVLASRFHFMLSVDETWTLNNLLPLFDPESDNFQPAWNGFLTSRRITPLVAQHLHEAFLKAVEHINKLADMQARFVKYYTAAFALFSDDPNQRWITNLFKSNDPDIRWRFALEINSILGSLDETQQREWWNQWLRTYWEKRLQNIPVPLEGKEIETMLGWTTQLTAVYPAAVDLAVQMPFGYLRYIHLQIYKIRKTGLFAKYPESVAKLLISMSQTESEPGSWHGAKEVIDSLMQAKLKPETITGLKEAVARLGL